MKTINTNRKSSAKEYSRFSVPGFRSGSVIKKFIAVIYYCLVFVVMCRIVATYVSGDFSGSGDVIVYIAVVLVLLAIFLTPVIVIGFSEHFDWHGIKLVLLIITPWCVLFTLGNYLCTLFSEDYINSVKPSVQEIETVDSINSAGEPETIDEKIVDDAVKSSAE